jgi:hypothetical protein
MGSEISGCCSNESNTYHDLVQKLRVKVQAYKKIHQCGLKFKVMD